MPPTPTFWLRLIEVLLIFCVCFIVAGDVPPNVNEAHYLGRLKHFWDPSWCAGDPFLESADTQLLFIWVFGWVTRVVSLAATAWIGRVVAWTFFAWAWQRLSWRVTPRPFASVLSATWFLALNAYANLAGEWVVGGVEGKCFAYPFVLLALGAIMDRRWNYAWLMLGAATAFHPLVGGWSGIVCVVIWVLQDRHDVRPWSMLPGIVAGACVGMVGIIPALVLTWGVPAEVVAESNRIYVFERLPHHLAPLSLPPDERKRRLVSHGVLLAAFFLLLRIRISSSQRQAHGEAAARKQDDIRGPTATSASEQDRPTPIARLAMFTSGAVLLAVIGFAIELALARQPLLAAKLLRYYWFRLTDFAVPMTVALQIAAIVAASVVERRKGATVLVFLASSLSGWYLLVAAWNRYDNPRPPADNKIVDLQAWVEVCEWIEKNTPPDAVFLTPRLNVSFKWRTGRPEVVNRKDIPQNAAGIVEWWRRIQDIYEIKRGDEEFQVDSVGTHSTRRVQELANKYNAQYVLSDRAGLLALPVVYVNEEYVVYHVEN